MDRGSVSRRRVLAATGAPLAIGFGGCLDESPGEDDPELGDPEPFVEIELAGGETEARIDPPVVHLVDGGTIEWVVDDGAHDTTAYHPATHGGQRRIPDESQPWTSGLLTANEGFDRTFDVEGVFDYVCTRHEEWGMVGTLVVGWPDPDGQPGLQPADDVAPDAAVDTIDRLNGRVREFLEDAHG